MNYDITASQLSAYGLTTAHDRALAQQAENRRCAKRLSRQGVVLVVLAFLAASCAGGLSYLGETQKHTTTTAGSWGPAVNLLYFAGLHAAESSIIHTLPGTSSTGPQQSAVYLTDACTATSLDLFADLRQQCHMHDDSVWPAAPPPHAAVSGALELNHSMDMSVSAEAAGWQSFLSPLQQLQASTPAGQGKDPKQCCKTYLPAIIPNDVAPTKVTAASETCTSGATEQQAPAQSSELSDDAKAGSAISAAKPSLITVLDLADHYVGNTRTAWLSMQAAHDEVELLGLSLPAFSKASHSRSGRLPTADPVCSLP